MWSSVVFAIAAQTLVPAGPWVEFSRDGDIVVQTRPIVGTEFLEFRATVEVPVPAAVMLDLAWGDGSRRDSSPSITSSELLEVGADRRISYEVAAAPIVSARDYVLLSTRHRDEGVIRFRSIVDARRPPRDGVVRIPRIMGHTAVTPLADGHRCRVVHTVFSETGGNIPAWIAKGGQRDNMVARLKTLRERAVATAPPR